ncbi:MAG: hypothetical protein OXI96_06530, partial [Acidimicrobiaceae bacterium]|nr:hypothetical protein [Acidimicrobiaceae bacterium]
MRTTGTRHKRTRPYSPTEPTAHSKGATPAPTIGHNTQLAAGSGSEDLACFLHTGRAEFCHPPPERLLGDGVDSVEVHDT